MKKFMLSTIILGVSLNFVACSNPVELNTVPELNTTYQLNNSNKVNTQISLEDAKQIALNHANLTNEQVYFVKASYDYDDGINKYEIEFYYNNTEYDYEINANNGEIIKFDYDAEYYNPSTNNNIPYSNNQNSSMENTISADEAKAIALQHANLSDNQVAFIKVSQDYDDGIHIYEVEFYYNNIEYSYEINANSGTILSFERD